MKTSAEPCSVLCPQDTQYDAVQANVQGCIANCYELQMSVDHRTRAANARIEMSKTLGRMNKALPATCGACLSDFDWDQASDPGNSIIVLPDCYHMHHLECLGKLRLKDIICPEDDCNTHLNAFDEMVYAGVHIQGPDSTAGRISAAMNRAGLDMLELAECLPPELLSAMTEAMLGGNAGQ